MIFILLALAIAPGLAIAIFIYERDKLDREPFHLLIKSFFLGILSIFPAIFIEFGVQQMGMGHRSGDIFHTGAYAVVVSFIEEICKYGVLIWFAYPKKEFDEPFDGITYAVMIAMGFATFENIAYVVDEGVKRGITDGMHVALWRMVSAVPAHAIFGILMGYFVGMAKFKHDKSETPLKITGLFAAVVFHAAYDFCLFTNHWLMFIGAFISLIVGVGLSLRAIQLHNRNSPFLDQEKERYKKYLKAKQKEQRKENEKKKEEKV